MRLGSETAYHKAHENWEALLHEKGAGEISYARELFALADTFAATPALTAALEDAARPADDRAALAANVLGTKTSGEVKDLVVGLARERWSESGDLVQVLEQLGVQTLFAGAEREHQLEAVESELYSMRAVLAAEQDLRSALSDPQYPVEVRRELLTAVLKERSHYSEELFDRALAHTPQMSLRASFTSYIDAVGERSQHLVASVTAAIPLTQEQENRLTNVLSRQFGKDVQIHTTVDPEVIGGVKVLVGSYVIDGTIASRLSAVKEVFKNGR
ncbi:MAG: F0F1 ATP synthase subunit delta [Arcanobacterium sp.]|nr:F0F1 ATP synthase subunit delta [Arcanobacterium sp.]